jgi:tRNA(Ile)-lysidine synthase
MSSSAIISLLDTAITQSLREQDCVIPLAADQSSRPAIAVAFSGGLDSSVLLCAAKAVADRLNISLFAFHVHHGLSANADAWRLHCQQTAEQLGVPFDAREVTLQATAKTGVEEAARQARYRALGAMCQAHGVGLLLTAHHQNDQAETILLHMLRGTGVSGLSGMDAWNVAPDLLGDNTLRIVRPLLHLSRAQLEAAAEVLGLDHVHDESNDDKRYTRNALRHTVMPVLAAQFPGFEQRFARMAAHAQAAQRLLFTLAQSDLDVCTIDGDLRVSQLRQLDTDRQDNLLRYWLSSQGLRLPSTAWLQELRVQLLEAKEDAQLCVTHPDCHVRRYRDRVIASVRHGLPDADTPPVNFVWCGEASIAFPSYHGQLLFVPSKQGVSADWLKAQSLQLGFRRGGERLKLAQNRPTKPIKYLYQALDIPAWERPILPILRAGDKVIYAAGLGLNYHHVGAADEANIAIHWAPL